MDGKLKILYVAPDAGMGGSSHSLLQLIKELRADYDVDPIVVVPRYIDGKLCFAEKCKETGIRCYVSKFYYFKGPKNVKTYIRFFLNLFVYYPILLYKLRKEKIDLVHSNSSVIDAGVFISCFKHVRHIWHLREFGDLDFDLYPVFGKRYERFIYKKADCFIAISKCIKQHFSQVIPESKIMLVYNGIVPKSQELDARHDNEQIKFVMVGAIQKHKNQLEALKALVLLRQWGYEVQLNIVGKWVWDYKEELDQYIRENSLEENVFFLGPRDDVPRLLSTMDVGLMLSECEAFGRVTVEYMLQNLMVIAVNTGANLEIIKDGVTGYIYSLGNIRELALKMKKCMDNKEEMLQMAMNGKVYAMQNFLSIKNTAAVYQIYKSL